jgi:hypothetical protein
MEQQEQKKFQKIRTRRCEGEIMATIALYASKINQMPGLIREVRQSVTDYKSELSSLKNKTLSINKSVCNLDDVISSIQTSSQTQEQKIASLDTFSKNSEQFIADAARIDGNVADLINQRKNEFYKEYSYLKPDCEKSGWEKLCDAAKSVGDWLKDNWKSLVKIALAVVIIVALGIATALTGGILGVILAGAFWGALSGALLGGALGGISSALNGGSFLEGFADGALTGAVTGAITGAACAGISVAGAVIGKGIQCLSKLGKAIKITSKVTKVMSLSMDGFDMLAMGIGFFDSSNPLVKFNQQLHSSALYNGFQVGVNGLALFTGGAASTMKCFVAGTMILTAAGFVAIETVRAGDKVTSTDPETFEVAEKKVLETYVRETTELVHLTINDESVATTRDHPFYVQSRGFVNAGDLHTGDKLRDAEGRELIVEDIAYETTETPTKVYNFQVEDFHTYHVGERGVLVHNANYQSPDKCVGETANAIEAEFPGRVEAINRPVYRSDGSILTDLDIELDTTVIQVKTGTGKGLTSQMARTATGTSKTVIGYTPDLNPSSALVTGAKAAGYDVLTSLGDLLDFLRYN